MLGIILGAIMLIIAIFLFLLLRHETDAVNTRLYKRISIILIIGAVFAIIFMDCFVTVPAGTVGVIDTFGSVDENEFPAGLHIKNPFSDVYIMSIMTQEIQEISTVPSKEGLLVTLETSILFKIDPTEANVIYKSIGPWYVDIVIVPQLRSTIRETTAKFEAKALYTEGRENITIDIYDILKPLFEKRGIYLENVLLRDLGLPLTVTQAIEMKLKAEQESEQMKFVLQKETQEAERKRIEASGIADAQLIIDKSLTPEYLKWYWITHLVDHSSVMYVPISPDGYPIMNIPIEER